MTFVLSLVLQAEAGVAKAEIAATAAEAKKLGAATQETGVKARTAGTGINALGNAADKAEADLRGMASAEALVNAEAVRVKQTHTLAAGSVGNLTAQFNDIGVMLAAGQNPLMLAIQQGTQISQVIGPMGAAGAVKALGAAFMGMINPVSLITLGSIAAGAAMVQWLTDAGEKLPTLQDAVEELANAVDAYEMASKRATASTAELRGEFGAAAADARKMLAELAEAELRATERAVQTANTALQDALQINAQRPEIGDQGRLADFFDLSLWSKEARRNINTVLDAFRGLDDAQGLQSQLEAAQTLQTRFKQVAEATGGISQAEDDVLSKISQQILAIQRLVALRAAAARAEAEGNGRAPGFEAAQAALDYRLEEQRLIQQANINAEAMIATLQGEATIRAQILLFGQNSELVTQNRLAAERESLAAQMQTEGVAADVAARVLESWDAATGFNAEAAGMSGFLSSAAAEAARMAGNIWNSVTAMAAVRNAAATYVETNQPGGAGDLAAQYAQYGAGRAAFNAGAQKTLAFSGAVPAPKDVPTRSGSSGSSSGISEIENQRKALDSLIEREERELAVLRETDPVRKEMLRNRDALAGATEAERDSVETLIATRMRETTAMETLQYASEQAGNALIDGLMGSADAGEQLIKTLQRAILQAALLGDGPLSGLMGTSGKGILGSLFGLFGFGGGSALPTTPFAGVYADGGMVHGLGSGTSDQVPILASNGEFMMNAKATSRYRHLLDAMNSGSPIPGFAGVFASGGPVGGAGAALAGAAPMSFVINDYSGQKVEATQGTDSRGQPQITMTIGQQAAAAVSQRGNPLRRAMQSEFAMTPAVRQRG